MQIPRILLHRPTVGLFITAQNLWMHVTRRHAGWNQSYDNRSINARFFCWLKTVSLYSLLYNKYIGDEKFSKRSLCLLCQTAGHETAADPGFAGPGDHWVRSANVNVWEPLVGVKGRSFPEAESFCPFSYKKGRKVKALNENSPLYLAHSLLLGVAKTSPKFWLMGGGARSAHRP